jgi:3-isopropylmalate/(R)-2-methylmalate dehydratase large subunit
MSMTITEKILAAHCDQEEVRPGQFINARVDLVMASELSGVLAIEQFERIKGAKGLFDPRKVVLIPDHFTPNKDIKTAMIAKKVREFAYRHACLYFEVGRAGIEHIVLPEKGLVMPGDLVIGGDSHTCTYGALGAFATGVGSTDVAAAMALGEVWLRVPKSIKLVYHGKPRKWVGGKDLILYTIGDLGVDGAIYKAMEFAGDALAYLSMADRFTMANMAVEAGAKTGIFVPDEKTFRYVEGRRGENLFSDEDAEYERVIEYDVSQIEPQVAFPYLPSNVKPISEVGEIEIDQVIIGLCTNGRIEDLRMAASLLKGRKIHPRVRAIVIPGSQRVYLEAVREGLIEIFIEAGCVVSTPTCGPCLGGHMGVLAAGERCVSTANRNFRGRGGHPDSEVYLASPAVAAASAIAGRIVGPDEIL